MTSATGSVATDGDRQWFFFWILMSVLVSFILLGILLGTRNKSLALIIVILSMSALLCLPLLLIFALGPPVFESADWTLLALSLFLELYLVGYTASWYFTDHAAIEKAKKDSAAKQRSSLTVGHVSICDYIGLGVSYIMYISFAFTGRFVMSTATDTGTQAVWVLLSVLTVFIFAGFAFQITRFTIHTKRGAIYLFSVFGVLFAISVILIVLAPTLIAVVGVEGLMSVFTGTIALVSGLHAGADCCINRKRLPWAQQPGRFTHIRAS